MRPVNLIPADVKGARSGGSGVPVYALLGVLALLVVMSAVYTLSTRSIDGKRQELAATTAQAGATEAKAAELDGYVEYSNMRKARAERVENLANSRFDWAQSLHDVARTLPSGTWITSLRATVNPNVTVDGEADPMRGSISGPAIELVGCARSQTGVAAAIASLRQMAGVQRVSLTNTQKTEGGAAPASTVGTGCGTKPRFSLTVFLEGPTAATGTTSTATGGTTP